MSHTATLRGLGRYGYRVGMTTSQALANAERAWGRWLRSHERELVLSGWRDERAEMIEA